MSTIRRPGFVDNHASARVDLGKVERDAGANALLEHGGLSSAQLRQADRNRDGALDAGEAWSLADGLDRDGAAGSLIDVDASGRATPAGQALTTLGLLMNNRALHAAPSATPSPTGASLPPAQPLRGLAQDAPNLPRQLHDGRLELDPSLLARVERDFGPAGRQRLQAWQDLVHELQGRDDAYAINRVDGFFNETVRYQSDRDNVGMRDYWQSPLETLASGAGDCEDYAVAKYVTLRQLGLPAERLHLAVVRTDANEMHAVTLATPGAGLDPMVLDNQRLFPVALSRRSDLTPIYRVNEAGGAVYGTNWTPVAVGNGRLQQFNSVRAALQRSRAFLPADAAARLD